MNASHFHVIAFLVLRFSLFFLFSSQIVGKEGIELQASEVMEDPSLRFALGVFPLYHSLHVQISWQLHFLSVSVVLACVFFFA